VAECGGGEGLESASRCRLDPGTPVMRSCASDATMDSVAMALGLSIDKFRQQKCLEKLVRCVGKPQVGGLDA